MSKIFISHMSFTSTGRWVLKQPRRSGGFYDSTECRHCQDPVCFTSNTGPRDRIHAVGCGAGLGDPYAALKYAPPFLRGGFMASVYELRPPPTQPPHQSSGPAPPYPWPHPEHVAYALVSPPAASLSQAEPAFPASKIAVLAAP